MVGKEDCLACVRPQTMFNFNSTDREGLIAFYRGCWSEVEVREGGSVPACALKQHLCRPPHLEGMRRHLNQLKTYAPTTPSDVAQMAADAALVRAGMTVSAAANLLDPDTPVYKVMMPVMARYRSMPHTRVQRRRMTASFTATNVD